jgi:L-lactate dehydrogenase complex protein LldG
MASDARTEILTRIRTATGGTGDPQRAAEEWLAIPRTYVQASTLAERELIEQLIDRLRDYDANVVVVDEGTVPATIAAMWRSRGTPRMVLPQGFPSSYLPPGLDFIVDTGLSAAELDRCGGVLTEAALAIAETGTLVLQNVAGQGRRAASLVPDYHLCLVPVAKVVGSVPEAFDWLQASAALATTFISGPSATADIEMTRIKGVHGPRFLDVVLYHSTNLSS